MARSSWSWVAGPVAALTGSLDRRAAWPPRVRWPGRLTLAVARRAAWTACRRPGPGARRRIEVAVAWRRARELGRLRRASAAAGDAGQMPSLPGPGVALVRRWCAHRVPADARGPGPGGMRYRARHLTIARCRPRWRPATGGRRDAIPVARLPTPGPPGRGRNRACNRRESWRATKIQGTRERMFCHIAPIRMPCSRSLACSPVDLICRCESSAALSATTVKFSAFVVMPPRPPRPGGGR